MEFSHAFVVDAPIAAVAAFHRDTSALRQLTPPPIVARLHQFEPLGEGSEARFTLWFGLLPVRWHAVHSDVSPAGFTDTQLHGPLKSWRHQHRFIPLNARQTRVEDHVTYEHDGGPRGLLSRLLFNRLGLLYLFTARKLLTRRHVVRLMAAEQQNRPG